MGGGHPSRNSCEQFFLRYKTFLGMAKSKRKSEDLQQSNGNFKGKRKKKKRRKCSRRPAQSITSEEHANCLSLFRAVDWSEVQNTSRLNVLGDTAKKNSKGKVSYEQIQDIKFYTCFDNIDSMEEFSKKNFLKKFGHNTPAVACNVLNFLSFQKVTKFK